MTGCAKWTVNLLPEVQELQGTGDRRALQRVPDECAREGTVKPVKFEEARK